MTRDMVDRGATPPPCPRCGGGTARVHRRASDHWFASLRRGSVLRFQCRSTPCGWSGLLAPDATPDLDRRRPLVAGALMALFVAVAAVGLFAVTSDRWGSGSDAELASAQDLAALRPPPRDVGVQVPPAGWHDVGQALPSDDARLAGHVAGLQIRHGCTWGVPGRDPYRGTAEQALQAAGLPDDAVRVIAQRIRRGESDGEVTLARDGIRSDDGQRQFGRRLVASTYGMTLCFDTLVNFAEGHVERAPLFEFTAADGRRFSVIVPDVCGNVGVISEQPSAGIVMGERAERAPAPVAPGAAAAPGSGVASPQGVGSYGAPMPAAAPSARAGGRPAMPPPSMGIGGHVPSPGGNAAPQPTLPPADPTAPATPGQPQTPPTGDSGPGTSTQPPTPVDPTPPADPGQPTPPPPSGNPDPGPGTQPPGKGDNPPPDEITPPTPTPIDTTPPTTPEPPTTPPSGDPGPGRPPPADPTPPAPTESPPTPTPTPDDPETPPPLQPPLWPPETDWPLPVVPPPSEDPPVLIPGDPGPPRQVPAPGTLSTGLLGLAALMLSRRWRRHRHGQPLDPGGRAPT